MLMSSSPYARAGLYPRGVDGRQNPILCRSEDLSLFFGVDAFFKLMKDHVDDLWYRVLRGKRAV